MQSTVQRWDKHTIKREGGGVVCSGYLLLWGVGKCLTSKANRSPYNCHVHITFSQSVKELAIKSRPSIANIGTCIKRVKQSVRPSLEFEVFVCYLDEWASELDN